MTFSIEFQSAARTGGMIDIREYPLAASLTGSCAYADIDAGVKYAVCVGTIGLKRMKNIENEVIEHG